MKILLDGYFDHNLGDDLLLTIAAKNLTDHELYIPSDKLKIDGVTYTNRASGFDIYLRVIGSGFIILSNRWLLYRVRDMIKERHFAKKRAVIGCNINSFINRLSESVITRQLRGYGLITVRDSFSYDYVRKKIPQSECAVYPDMVFSLPDSMIPDVQSDGALGICVHNGEDFVSLAAVADGYIERTGKAVRLLCFNTGAENDESAADKIVACAKHTDMISKVPYENIPDMLMHIKRCGVILGVRFHSIVLAMRMGVPFVAMSYSEKTNHVLEDLEYGGVVYNSRNFSTKKVLDSVLSAKPYNIDPKIIEQAKGHTEKFKEYIKQA